MRTLFVIILVSLLYACINKKPPQKTESYNEISQNSFETLSVMSFNVLYSTSFASTLQTIKFTNPDIIGLQESDETRMKAVADTLNYYYYSFDKSTGNLSDHDTGILSRYPISQTFNDGVIIDLPKKLKAAVFSVHLSPYPYEPYDFRDGKISTAYEAEASARKTRMPEIMPVLITIDSLINEGIPVFLTGDFNEPSHLDWTARAAQHGLHFSKSVQWPCSKAVLDVGMQDAYRTYYPNEVEKQGITWTTNLSENEVYDRIDFVYHHLQNMFELIESRRVGRLDNNSHIGIEGYESDHYAVFSIYRVLE
jgi:endonuclease/exonuclease/phosphatase family metal-dependent hydrolase